MVSDAISLFGVDIDPHLERDVEIPVSASLQRQGDIIVIPTPKAKVGKDAKELPLAGYPLVRGENGGNTHLLLGTGWVTYTAREPSTVTQLDIATFTVAEGAVAYIAHPEHGYLGVAPGTYTVRRQKEQADEIRMVAD
jgi:hypothetical protein